MAHGIGPQGGMELVHAELIRRLSGRYQFSVVAAELEPDLRELVRWYRIRVPRRPVPVKVLVFALSAGARLSRMDVDLVHACGAIVPNRVSAVSVHFCHTGYVRLHRALAPTDMPRLLRLNTAVKRVIALALERWCYRPRRLDALLAVSAQVEAELKESFPDVPVRRTPNGVDMDVFRPDPTARRERRDRAGVADNETVCLFVGGDWGRKGLGSAIAAVAAARRAGAPASLWVVGAGDQERYEQVATQAGVADAVRFWGHQTETAPWYQAADIFVSASSYETFSLALLEAAACGLPLVTTGVGVALELFQPGPDDLPGRLVDATPAAIGAAIIELSSHRDERDRCRRAARRRAEPYSWDRLATEVDRLYRDLLRDQGPGR